MREEISLSLHPLTNYGSSITSSQNCDSPEITIEFYSFLLSRRTPFPFLVLPPSTTLSFSFTLSLSF